MKRAAASTACAGLRLHAVTMPVAHAETHPGAGIVGIRRFELPARIRDATHINEG